MLKTKDGYEEKGEAGLCPDCFYSVRIYAYVSGYKNWRLVAKCDCEKIKNELEWPFTKGPSIKEVTVPELKAYPGIFAIIDPPRLSKHANSPDITWYDQEEDEREDMLEWEIGWRDGLIG